MNFFTVVTWTTFFVVMYFHCWLNLGLQLLTILISNFRFVNVVRAANEDGTYSQTLYYPSNALNYTNYRIVKNAFIV
jgi:hypothetical protein